MKGKNNIAAKITAGLLALILAIGLLSASAGAVYADSEDVPEVSEEITDGAPPKVYTDIMGVDDVEPEEYTWDSEPYGHAKNEPFILVQQDELMVYRHNGVKDTTVTSYGNLKKENTGYPLKGNGKSKDFKVTKHNTLSFVQTVAFDPTGSGRKDHIAVLGVYADHIGKKTDTVYVYVYVMDKKGRTSEQFEVGHSHWMANDSTLNSDNMWDFNAMNFLSITAGDYNGDGKDSLAVYACCNSPTLCTIDADVTDSSIKLKGQSPDNKLLHNYFNDSNDRWVGNRLHCALDSGDIDGDGIDDLVVLSYVGRMTKDYRKEQTYLYVPSIVVSRGVKDSTQPITKGEKASGYHYVTDKSADEGEWRIVPAGAGLSVGDLDGDGICEIVVAGFYHQIKGYYGSKVEDPYKDYDSGKLVVGVYNGKLEKIAYQTDLISNKWTQGGSSAGGLWVSGSTSDDSFQQTCVKTVAINGKGSAEYIFINGDLYNYANRSVNLIKQNDFFGKTNLGMDGLETIETYVRSAAVGVFDGNEEGREQIVYVLGAICRTDSTSDAYVRYHMGMMGGVFEKDGQATTTAQDFYATSIDSMDDTSHYYPGSASRCEADSCLSFSVCAWNDDCDGLHVKYVDKSYTYSDPDVMAVLQAPPFFSEINSTASTHSTNYTISKTYQLGQTKGDSVSFGVGLQYDYKGPVVQWSAYAGYAMNWSEKYTKLFGKTDEYTFSAKEGSDQVVIFRTPVTVYYYQVEVDDTWSNDNLISIAIPGEPSRSCISVDEYNTFVEYYNEQFRKEAEEVNAKAGKTVIEDKDISQLTPLKAEYLGCGGDPFSYMTPSSPDIGQRVLQKGLNSFVVGQSSTGFSYKEQHTSSKTVTWQHGISLNGSIGHAWKAEVFEVEVDMSLSLRTSLQYMNESSSTSTIGIGAGASCTISNMDPDKFSSIGLSREVADMYGFEYQMVTWPSNLPGKDVAKYNPESPPKDKEWFDDGWEKNDWFKDDNNGTIISNYVPVYGYQLTNVHAGPLKVTDLKGEFINDKTAIKLTWTEPTAKNRKVAEYVLYRIKKNGDRVKVATLPAGTNEYTFTELESINDFQFVIKTTMETGGVEGVDSNPAVLSLNDDLINYQFPDVDDPEEPYFKPVYWAAGKDIVRGYSNGYFGPGDSCTREQFVIMLWRFAGREDTSGEVDFSDVNSGMSSYKAIQWAVNEGIIAGFSDGTFRPEDTVTRQQVAIMLWRMNGKPSAEQEVKFADISSETSGYKAIQWGSEAGLIKGYSDNTFRPEDPCLRMHIVIFLYRYARDVLGQDVR